MPGVFVVNNDFTVVLSREAIQLCPLLGNLNQEQLLYIILAYDYVDSPYRRKPMDERKEMARKRIWKDKKFIPEDLEKISKAIEEYCSIIYDHNRTIRDTYLSKLNMIDSEIMNESNPDKLRNLITTQKIIEERLDETEIKISRDENMVKLRGNKSLSFIELFQRNREEYLEKMKNVVRQNGIPV